MAKREGIDSDLVDEKSIEIPAVVSFTGIYEHSLDAKGRVSLPSKVRRFLPKTLKTVLSLDKHSVLVFSPEAYVTWWKEGIFKGRPVDPTSKRDMNLFNFVTRYAVEVDVDSAGRILIDPRLRQVAKLEGDVTIFGADDHLAIVPRGVADAEIDDLLELDFIGE